MITVSTGYSYLNSYLFSESAISDAAFAAREFLKNVLTNSESSEALFGHKAKALTELRQLADDCSADDWDSYGAQGIEALSFWNAESFVKLLPNSFLMPEFVPEPDGAISMDWAISPYSVFSVSVGTSNRLAYAWVDGSDHGRGVISFDGSSIPPKLLIELRRII